MTQFLRFALSGLLALLAACASPAPAPQGPPRIPDQVSKAEWEQDMQRFAAEDAVSPPPRNAVLFVGSSSIRLWETLASDFPGVPVIPSLGASGRSSCSSLATTTPGESLGTFAWRV